MGIHHIIFLWRSEISFQNTLPIWRFGNFMQPVVTGAREDEEKKNMRHSKTRGIILNWYYLQTIKQQNFTIYCSFHLAF